MLLVFPWFLPVSVPTILLITIAVFAIIGPSQSVGGSIGRIIIAGIAYAGAMFWSIFGVLYVSSGHIYYATGNAFQPTSSKARAIKVNEPDFSGDYGVALLLNEPIRPFIFDQLARLGNDRLVKIDIHRRGDTNFAALPLNDILTVRSQGAVGDIVVNTLFMPHSSSIFDLQLQPGKSEGDGYFYIGVGVSVDSYVEIKSIESDSAAPWHWVNLQATPTIDEIDYVVRLENALTEFTRSRNVRALSIIQNAPVQALSDIELARANYLELLITSNVTAGMITRLQSLSTSDKIYELLLTDNAFERSSSFLRRWLVVNLYQRLRATAGEEDSRTRTLYDLIASDRDGFREFFVVRPEVFASSEAENLDKAINYFGWPADTAPLFYQLSKAELFALDEASIVVATETIATSVGENNCIAAFKLGRALTRHIFPYESGEEFIASNAEEILSVETLEALSRTQSRGEARDIFRARVDSLFYPNFDAISNATRKLGAACSDMHRVKLENIVSQSELGREFTLELVEPYFHHGDVDAYEAESLAVSIKWVRALRNTLSEDSLSEAIVARIYDRFLDWMEQESTGIESANEGLDDIFEIFTTASGNVHPGEFPWWRLEYQAFFAEQAVAGFTFARNMSFGPDGKQEFEDGVASLATKDLPENMDAQKTIDDLRNQMLVDFVVRDRRGEGVIFLPGVIVVAIATEEIEKPLSLSLKSSVERILQLAFDEALVRLLPDFGQNEEPLEIDESALAQTALSSVAAGHLGLSSIRADDDQYVTSISFMGPQYGVPVDGRGFDHPVINWTYNETPVKIQIAN